MKIHSIIAHNPLQNIFYVLEYWDKQALVIDPPDTRLTQDFLNKHDLELQRILITHEHYDHYDGVEWLNCNEVYAWSIATKNMPVSVTHIFEDWEIIFDCGDIKITAVFTPGHSDGHMMFVLSENNKVTTIFSWDVLFQWWVGHTRRGWTEELYNSLRKFKKYDDGVIIYSGHDYLETNCSFLKKYTPENILEIDAIWKEKADILSFTTLGEERIYNPFLTVEREEFIRLRELRNNF